MSTLRKPTVGPIIGHTTDTSCKVWISAVTEDDWNIQNSESNRTIGVLALISKGKINGKNIFYFRLKREYDRSGVFNIGRDTSLDSSTPSEALKPGQQYEVRVAIMRLDDALHNDDRVNDNELAAFLPKASKWRDVFANIEDSYAVGKFKTFPKNENGSHGISFLLGSCRYPGLLWGRKNSDRIFKPMRKSHGDVNFQLMVGDQIYADKFNSFSLGLADTYKEFQERYYTAYSSRNMQRLLSEIPTYMILDDHEIEDNWHHDRILKEKGRKVFNLAMHAYMSYQWSHGPRNWNNSVETSNNTAVEDALHENQIPYLYYDFLCNDYPFFVLDVRSQRIKGEGNEINDDNLDNNHMLGRPPLSTLEPGQLNRFLYWLKYQQDTRGNIPKFIVTSSVFVPNTVDSTRSRKHKNNDDCWAAFPETRRALLDLIVKERIQNVIFLSGDIHCACISELKFSKNTDIRCYSIVSSAYYWPFPFADGDPSTFVHDSAGADTPDAFPLSDTLGEMNYTTWGFSQADNFSRLDIDDENNQLSVQFFNNDGEPLKTSKPGNVLDTHPHVIELHDWKT